MSARPGFPDLTIDPVHAVVEPVTFTATRGDDADPGLDALRHGLSDVRLEVFVTEQAVPFVEEVDARDFQPTTVHVLARGADGTPLGAGRILLEPEHPGQVHLGRLAVRLPARGTGLGARLVAALEEVALEHAAVPLERPDAAADANGTAAPSRDAAGPVVGVNVLLSAQEQAMGFYERCGYQPTGGARYLDAGIWHRDMARTLTRCPSS